MIVSHNLVAMNAQRQFNIVGKAKKKTTEKLASGYRINRAADDAAGLAISEKMRRQIRGLHQTRDNIQDGISYCNVADGALNEVSDMLNRIEELTVQAMNGTNTDEDRGYIDKEVQQITAEIERIFKETSFNEKKIWPPELYLATGGLANDYSLYTVKDDTGEYYGGISYMGHRYSWTDLGIGWDKDTHTFTSNATYKIDGKILKNDAYTSIDDYDSAGSTAVFTITTVKDMPVAQVQKNYTWFADDTGIRIDGVMTNGANNSTGEGNTTWAAVGLTPGQEVKQGTYSCYYYGQEISFEVPEDMDWSDLLEAINNPAMAMDWHSTVMGTSTPEQNVKSSTSVSKVYINHDDKDNIAQSYKVVADGDKIYIKSNSSAVGIDKNTVDKQSASTSWSNLSNTGAAGSGQYGIGTWGTDAAGNDETSKSDAINAGDSNTGSSYISTSEDASYTFKADSKYITTDGKNGGLDFTLKIQDDQSKTDIVNDVDSIFFNVSNTQSPVTVVGNGTEKVHVSANPYSNISFYTQRDLLDRQYNSNTENIVTDGSVYVDDLGRLAIDINGYSLKSAKTLSSIESSMESAMNGIYSSMISSYNNAMNTQRYTEWNEYIANTTSLWSDLNNITYGDSRGSVADQYVINRLNGDAFASFSDEKLATLFAGIVLDKVLVDDNGDPILDANGDEQRVEKTAAEKLAAIRGVWNGLSSSEKLTTFEAAFDTDASRNQVIKTSVMSSSSNQAYVQSQITGYSESKYVAFDDLIGFTISEKVQLYKNARASYWNKSVSDSAAFNKNTTITFNGTQNGDQIQLTFDLSGIKYSELINAQDDAYISGRINNSSNSALPTSASDTFSEVKSTSQMTSFLKNEFTTPTFTLKGNGESYQNVSMTQTSKSSGTTVINLPEIITKRIELEIQSGTESDQQIKIEYDNMRLSKLGLRGLHVDTVANANAMLTVLGNAQRKVSMERSEFGAYTNRLEHAYNNNYNVEENTTAAESRIRDTDMAKEMVQLSIQNVIEQAGYSMMAQANQSKQGVLTMLQ